MKMKPTVLLGYLLPAVLLAFLPIIGAPRSWLLYVFLFCIYLAMSNMWNLLAGYSGLVSLCQPAFLGIAGYAMVIGTWMGVPWYIGLVGGGILAAIFALLLSNAVFRLTGVYFSIGTMVVPEALRMVFYLWRPVGGAMQGGGAGYMVKGVESLTTHHFYWLALAIAVISMLIMRVVHIAFWAGVSTDASRSSGARSLPAGGWETRRVPFPSIRLSSDQVPYT